MKKSNVFWVGYADLITSLFFIMLVLYVVTMVMLKSEKEILLVKAKQLEAIQNVEKALSNLDPLYFLYDNANKRYKLAIDARFKSNSADIRDIPIEKRKKIYNAGIELYSKMENVIAENPNINYLLIIEGNTQRSSNNWLTDPDMGYELSYYRALSLYNYWLANGLDFKKLGQQCEVILAGSGYFSHSRDMNNENNNRRFSIQITSKVGQFLDKTEMP